MAGGWCSPWISPHRILKIVIGFRSDLIKLASPVLALVAPDPSVNKPIPPRDSPSPNPKSALELALKASGIRSGYPEQRRSIVEAIFFAPEATQSERRISSGTHEPRLMPQVLPPAPDFQPSHSWIAPFKTHVPASSELHRLGLARCTRLLSDKAERTAPAHVSGDGRA